MKIQTLFLLIASSVILITHSVSASSMNFAGVWAGQGKMTAKGGFFPSSECSSIEVEISQANDHFEVISYLAKCGSLTSDWGNLRFDVSNNEVLHDGEKMGTITDDTFISTIPNGGVLYAVNFKVQKDPVTGAVTLQSYYGTKNLLGTVVIEGQLRPRP